MDDDVIATHFENLDRRLSAVEQILPTVATKEDLLTLATKKDLLTLATKEELQTLATKEALRMLATREELRLAIEPLATKGEVRAEGERSRLHMTMLVEHQDSKIELLAEHVLAAIQKHQGE